MGLCLISHVSWTFTDVKVLYAYVLKKLSKFSCQQSAVFLYFIFIRTKHELNLICLHWCSG